MYKNRQLATTLALLAIATLLTVRGLHHHRITVVSDAAPHSVRAVVANGVGGQGETSHCHLHGHGSAGDSQADHHLPDGAPHPEGDHDCQLCLLLGQMSTSVADSSPLFSFLSLSVSSVIPSDRLIASSFDDAIQFLRGPPAEIL